MRGSINVCKGAFAREHIVRKLLCGSICVGSFVRENLCVQNNSVLIQMINRQRNLLKLKHYFV